jgi:malonyl-CoA O-methyltransferase
VRALSQYFSRSARRYHASAHFQRQIAATLAERTFDSIRPETILEVGCGTGFLTRLLVDRYPRAAIDAVDLSSEMICLARQNLPAANVRWHVDDMNRLDADRQIDLVASSTALHWGDPVDRLIQRLGQMLRPGGKMVAAVMTAGTLGELHRVRQEIAPDREPARQLPSASLLRQALAKAGMVIDDLTTVVYRRRFASSRELIRQLSQSGFTGGSFARDHGRPLVRSQLNSLTSRYHQQYGAVDGAVHATFNVTYLAAAVPCPRG